MDFFLQGELLHFSVVYLYSRSQDLSILTMPLGLSETVSGSTVFLPTDFGRRTIANITVGMQESSFSLKQWNTEKCRSLNGLEVVDDGGFYFQVKDYGTCQGSWSCCGKDCYYFSKTEKNWMESKKSCQELGASLIKIDDQEEQVCLLHLNKCFRSSYVLS